MTVGHAADRLLQAIDEKQNPAVVGLDPELSKLPEDIKAEALREFGDTVEGVCQAIVRFNRGIIDAVCDVAAIVKPQVAFYEQYGWQGFKAFIETAAYASTKGMLVIGDVKRGDIGSTADAYARGLLGETKMLASSRRSLDLDWITVNPYLGEDGIRPFISSCEQFGKGIFILVKTSNPSSAQFQDIEAAEKRVPMFHLVAEHVQQLAAPLIGTRGYSAIGAVVGATYPEQAVDARRLMPRSIFLVPGYGAQGGTADDLAPFFNDDGYGAVVNSSRGIIFAFREDRWKNGGGDWTAAVRQSAISMRDDIRRALRACGKLPKGW